MRILFLSQRFLLPMDTGGKIRTGKLLEQLRDRCEVTLVSNVEHPRDDAFVPEIERLGTRFVPVPWREVRKRTVRFYLRLLGRSARAEPINVLNDFSPALKRAVEDELAARPYDLAICDFVQSALMFRDLRGVPTLLFQHNVESEIARRHSERAPSWIARVFWRLQWRRMLRFEREACQRFDAVVAVSRRDADQMESLYGVRNVETIPTGVDTEFYQAVSDDVATPGTIVFCGSMDWLPNEDAMSFFVTEVLPIVRRSVPQATLTIVGRHPSAALERLVGRSPGVRLTGWVEDTRPFIRAGHLFIVPIRVGGGTRLKIYEGMAMERAVVSTSVGAEGLDVEDGRTIVLADGAAAFAAATISLLIDDTRRRAIAAAGRAHVVQRFSWARVADAFVEICQRTVARSGQG